MHRLILVVLLTVCGGGSASGTVITGSDYYTLGEEYQRGYIHAFVDSLLINKPVDHWASLCVLDGMTPWQLGDILDARLETHPEERHRPIQITLWRTLSEACGKLGYE